MRTTLGIAFSEKNCQVTLAEFEKNTVTIKQAECVEHEALASIKRLATKKTRVIIGIPSESVMLRDFTFDSTLSDSEIMRFLKEHSLDLFGHPEKEIAVDFERKLLEAAQQRIVVIAAHKKLIAHYEHLFLKENIRIDAIYVNDLAIKKMMRSKYIINTSNISKNELADFNAAIALCLWSKNER